MPIAYRTIIRGDSAEISDQAIDQVVGTWLQAKRLELPPPNGSIISNGKTLSHFRLDTSEWSATRWTLDEIWSEPSWFTGPTQPNRHGVTTITAVRVNSDVWFWVEVDSPLLVYKPSWSDEVIEEPQTSGTPMIVTKLMDAFELVDGRSPAMPEVLTISSEQHYRGLLASLADEERFSAIYVSTPPPEETLDSWKHKVEALTQGSTGMAINVVIDPNLTQQILPTMGFKHSIPSGALRTFLPGVKFFDDSDGYRHKLLTSARISVTRPEKLARILRRAQVLRLSQVRLPRLLLEVDSELLRKTRFTGLKPTPDLKIQVEAAEKLSDFSRLEALAEVALFERGEFESLANQYANENNVLKQQLNDYKEFAEIAEYLDADLSAARREIAQLESRLTKLQVKLSASGLGAEAYEDMPLAREERYPEDFDELVSRVGEFNFLVFAGDVDDALKLDDHPGIQSGLIKAWETLKTLNSYATFKKTGRFSQGLVDFTRNTSHGGFVRIPEVKASESSSVMSNPRLANQRRISVPLEVDETGFVHTKSHVALQNGISNYPRLYFFDATGRDGRVYIGYIGEHLENTRTN